MKKKTTMNQNTAGALFPSFAYSQFKKEVFKQPLMLDNNCTGIDYEKEVKSLI
jgi:hypothetical protein